MQVKHRGKNLFFNLEGSSKIHSYRFLTSHETTYARDEIKRAKTIVEANEVVKKYKGKEIKDV